MEDGSLFHTGIHRAKKDYLYHQQKRVKGCMLSYYRMGFPAKVPQLVCFKCPGVSSVKNKPTTCLTNEVNDFVMALVNSKPAHPTCAFVIIYYIVACKQALLFGRAKRTARERASEQRNREGPPNTASSSGELRHGSSLHAGF